MKNRLKISTMLLFGCLFCMVGLRANVGIEDEYAGIFLNDDILGYWDYTVTDVDPMYQKGVIHVAKEDGNYTVNIELPSGSIPTEDVEVNDNELKFALYVEGERIEVTVIFEGDTLTGSGNSSNGPFTISGSRKAPPE